MAGLFFHSSNRAAVYSNKFIKTFTSRICILLFAVVLGGCPNNRGVGKSVTVDIPSTGGTITLEGIASVAFPNGAFPTTQQVRLETTRNAATDELFQLSAVIFSPGARSTYEVRINTGDTQPQSESVSVSLNIPSGLGNASTIQMFAQVFDGTVNDTQDGYDELHDGFELYPSTLDANSEQLHLELPWSIFSAGRLSDGSHEATLILAATPEISQSSGNAALALNSGSCPTSPIGPPLEQLTRIRGFNISTKTTINGKTINGHPGTDYVAKDGDAILAVGDGTVVQAVESNGKKLMEDNGGAGGVVVIAIPGTGMVRYMHLKKGTIQVEKGEKVVCGQLIAAADNTGYSSGSHLHFELALGSNYMRNRVDLEPCLDEKKCEAGFDGTFQFTREWRNITYPDDIYSIQSVEGTLHWEFWQESVVWEDNPSGGAIVPIRLYILTEATTNVTRDEDDNRTCVAQSPVSFSDPYGNGSTLIIYPTEMKYQMEIDLNFFYQANCTLKSTGENSSEEIWLNIVPALAFNCTESYNFPDDFIKYSIPENYTLNNTYSLNDCISNDESLTINGGWTFTRSAGTP
jgi:hypothetical protein